MSRSRGKKKKTSAPKAVVARNEYVSKCCDAPAIKPALQARSDYKSAKISEFGGLGKWRCSVCKKRCAVGRSKIKEESAA